MSERSSTQTDDLLVVGSVRRINTQTRSLADLPARSDEWCREDNRSLRSGAFSLCATCNGVTEFRSINIINFIRAEEPREPMDLFLPVREQMKLIKAHNFPATWLLQYDALVEGPFVDFLKAKCFPAVAILSRH